MTPIESAFLSKVGTSLATGIVKQAGARFAKKLRKTETQQALERCGQAAVEALVEEGFPSGTEIPREHLEDVLGQFAGDEAVHDILARAIREGSLPQEEVAELRESFEEAHPPETLPGFAVERGIAAFVTAFVDQAAEETEFQGVIQTRELRAQTGYLRDQLAEARGQTALLEAIRDRIPERRREGKDLEQSALRTSYLNHLFTQLRKLALSGVDPALAGDPKARLDLDAVYTALLTRAMEDHRHLIRRALEAGRDSEAAEPSVPGIHPVEPRLLSALEQLDRHDRLVLLGDPGSGKSTFVSFVALCMAGQLLAREDANLELLTSPLSPDEEHPQSKNEEEKAEPQPWRYGALLPVRVVLRDFAAMGLPGKGEKAGARHLLDYFRRELERAGLDSFADQLERELREEGGLLLLDGLDEVPEAEDRRVQLRAVVEDVAAAFPKCRILVTSRIYAYQDQDWRLDGFREATLAPFSPGQIRRFIQRWYDEVARRRGLTDEDARGKAALLEVAVFGSPRLRSLAERPLLLTLMASLHAWRGGTLPEKRERLYADTVELLLSHWESQRVVHGPDGEVIVQQPSLAEWLKVDPDRLRSTLEELAFRAHATQEDLEGTADLAEGDLLAALKRVSAEAQANPVRLVEFLETRAGLLLPRGVGVYTFPHRTFQEYLAACHLTGPTFPEELARLGRTEPERWREAVLLAGAKAARGAASTAWHLARELSFRDPGTPDAGPEDHWGALLAGQVLAESADLETPSEANSRELEELRRRLVAVLRGETLPAVERALAGRVLAELGDPREEVMTLDGMELCWVPPGPFRMGSEEAEREQPVHDLDLPYGYWIGRYPVTVAQFHRYVEESGEEPGDRASLGCAPNEPVGWVSWFEARRFCDWLSDRWREAGNLPEGWSVRLPSEAEWEKAARGGTEVPAAAVVMMGKSGNFSVEPDFEDLEPNEHPGRTFPWGDGFAEDRANTQESGVSRPSAVGCFASGVSPYGCEELAGNVVEWTRSLWGEAWLEPAFRYPYVPDDGRENLEAPDSVWRVLRGGGFYNLARYARCSVRGGYYLVIRNGYYGFRLLLSPFSSDL